MTTYENVSIKLIETFKENFFCNQPNVLLRVGHDDEPDGADLGVEGVVVELVVAGEVGEVLVGQVDEAVGATVDAG